MNLGVDLWVCASVIRKLMEYDIDLFGDLAMQESDRLLIAYERFRDWTRTNRIVCLALHIFQYAFEHPNVCCKFQGHWAQEGVIHSRHLRHSMPRFRPWRLRSRNHPWPELQSKAYNVTSLFINRWPSSHPPTMATLGQRIVHGLWQHCNCIQAHTS